MIGITIGVGEQWNAAAKACAHRMSEMTGLECKVIDTCPESIAHPSWLKAHVIGMFPEYDSFLVFDADIIPSKHWNPKLLFEELGRPFCAVPDRNWAATQRECTKFNMPWPDWYVNGGLTMFGKEHAIVWEYVLRKHPKYGSWLEQTALNEALLKLGTNVCRLPHRFNQLYSGSSPVARSEAINLHLAGCHSPDYIIATLERFNAHRNEIPRRDENRLVAEPA